MKITMKFRIKSDPDGKIRIYQIKDDKDEGTFLEFDSDFFNTLYQMFPPNIIKYYTEINKVKENPITTDNQPIENLEANTGNLPANGHDIFNYVAKFGSANLQIQVIMKLNGRIDFNKLLKAVRLSVDAEPVFGCRFVENDPPYFQRLHDIDNTVFCSFEKTSKPDEAIQRFLESPLYLDHDPMIKLKLISSSPYDTLCLKINHTCCDGTGTKEYIQLLSDIYSQIDQPNGTYEPKPKLRSRRDQDRLFSALGIKDPDAAWNGQLDIPKNMWTFPWQQGKQNIPRISVCKLPYGYLNILSKYAKARGATINDLLITAFYRAMFKMSQPKIGEPMTISMTVDLRRYLPEKKTEAIRNFSGGIDTHLASIENESFEGTLFRVVPMMNEIKNSQPGLQSAVGLERVEKANFYETLAYYKTAAENLVYTDKCSPVLSNLSFMSKSLYKFGKTVVTDAYIAAPAICAPGILLCISTYNGMMTFTLSYYEAQVRSEYMNRLLNQIKNELITGCRL